MANRVAVFIFLVALILQTLEASSESEQDSSQQKDSGNKDPNPGQDDTKSDIFSDEYFDMAKDDFIQQHGLETLYDFADPALKHFLDNIIFKAVFGVKDEEENVDNRDVVMKNGFKQLKQMLLPEIIAKKNEAIRSRHEGKEHSITAVFQSIGKSIGYAFDTNKSVEENVNSLAPKITSELKTRFEEQELEGNDDEDEDDDSNEDSDAKDKNPDIPLPDIDYDDLVEFFQQFEPQIEEVLAKWHEYIDALEDLGDLIKSNQSRAGFDYDKALQVYDAAKIVVEKKKEWIESLVELGKDIVEALRKKSGNPKISIDPIAFLKALTLQAQNNEDTGVKVFNKIMGIDFSSGVFINLQNTILAAIDIDDLKEFFEQFDPQIQEVIDKWEDYLDALKDLNDLLNTTDSRAGFDYDRALQIFQQAERVLWEQEEWMDAVIELAKAIANALRDIAGDPNASINPEAFLNAIRSLKSSSMTLPKVVQQYNAWYNDPDRASKPFVYSSSDIGADNGRQLAAEDSSSDGHHGASSGETAMIVVGCLVIVSGVALTGGFLYRRRSRQRLYTRLPPVWENHELTKTSYNSADSSVHLLPSHK